MKGNPMKQQVAAKPLASIAACAAFSLLAGVAHASGSDSFPTTSSGTSMYNTGKQVFSEQLACKGCAFEGKSIDKAIAMQIVSDKKITEKLSTSDRDAVVAYAKKRFRIE
jgi:hypothetical protein